MASAASRTTTQVVVKAVEEEVKLIDLTLTEEEATFLALIMSRIGGDPQGHRKHQEAIQIALMDAGVNWSAEPAQDMGFTLSGTLYFPPSSDG